MFCSIVVGPQFQNFMSYVMLFNLTQALRKFDSEPKISKKTFLSLRQGECIH